MTTHHPSEAGTELGVGKEVTITRVFDARRELVYDVWTDERHIASWFGPRSFTNPLVEMDVRPGGRMVIHMQGPDGSVFPSIGTFTDVTPPERLAFTSAAYAGIGGPFLLEDHTTITFTERGNQTEMTLHAVITRAVPEATEALAGMEQGWNESFDKLAAYVATAEATVNDRAVAMNHASAKATTVPATAPRTGYAPVNGLRMYYEIHGAGHPLVMLHGGLETIDYSLGGELLPALAETRQVIAIEQQGHGHTADIDRPLTYEQMTEDTAALLRHLEITDADVFGYSMGGMTALGLATRHPDLVRKLVIVSAPYNNGGMRSENLAGMQSLTPEALAGSPQERAYLRAAPNPGDWPTLLTKMGPLQRDFKGWPAEDVRSFSAPTLFVFGDSDAIPLDHVVELFRLRGGDVNGDFYGVPASRLAILPGTTHIGMMTRADLLLPMVSTHFDAPTSTA